MEVEEYKGQKVIAELAARLIPPNDNYPDCECLLVLTDQHLYVLEDNYDGTYEAHFEFVLREIDSIEIKKVTSEPGPSGPVASAANEILTAVVTFFAGVTILGGNGAGKKEKKLIVLHYHNEWGIKDVICFNMRSPAGAFLKTFEKIKNRPLL